MDAIQLINPLDSRYRRDIQPLLAIFSEQGFIQYRVFVEIQYLIALSVSGKTALRRFTTNELNLLKKRTKLNDDDCKIVEQIETTGYKDIPATNHDVKAVEYFLKLKLKNTSLADIAEWIHFALTSEDINSVSYGLMLSDAVANIIIPKLETIAETLSRFAKKHRNLAMLARTHGQPASPTTLGKEFAIFADRLQNQILQLRTTYISVKFSGATGNYNAHLAAYPKVNWVAFTDSFIKRLNIKRKIKLSANHFTTQIDPHDTYAQIFDILRRINIILINFDQDIWHYISEGWLAQKPVAGEIGSSAMPHKINPIDFEKSEGNLGMANALFGFFSGKLPISRLQRDLSDSTVQRNFGVALGYSVVAYNSLLRGLKKTVNNIHKISDDLKNHPEVIAEGIQTILRREGISMPYEKFKLLVRGRTVTLKDLYDFIDNLDVSNNLKKELKRLRPENYIGNANKI